MIKNYIIAILFIFCLSSVLHAGNGDKKKMKSFSLSGKVVDNAGSLTGVKVVLDNKEVTVYTDFDGNFTIDNLKEGIHTLSFSMVAYDNKTISFNPSQENILDIKLYGR